MPSMLSFVLPFFSIELVVRQRLGQKPTTLPPLKIHHRGEISRSSRPSRLVRLVTLKILLEDDCQRLSVGALAWHGVTALSRLSELRSLGKSALVTMSRLSRSIFPLPGGELRGSNSRSFDLPSHLCRNLCRYLCRKRLSAFSAKTA